MNVFSSKVRGDDCPRNLIMKENDLIRDLLSCLIGKFRRRSFWEKNENIKIL